MVDKIGKNISKLIRWSENIHIMNPLSTNISNKILITDTITNKISIKFYGNIKSYIGKLQFNYIFEWILQTMLYSLWNVYFSCYQNYYAITTD